ncbi:MAG: hypothetical protein ACRDID_25015, partial [Ktedonobacterales bacterium]
HPGADRPPSDTGAPSDTPVLYANPDGSNATRLFGDQLAASLVSEYFSPDGALAVTNGSSYSASSSATGPFQMKLATVGGGVKTIDGQFGAWRTDSAAMVITVASSQSAPPVTELYSVSTGAMTPAEAGSGWYLWGD